MKDFCLRFKMYDDQEEALPIIRAVLPSEIEQNYYKIIEDISNL